MKSHDEENLDEVTAGRILGGSKPISPRTLQGWRLRGKGPRFVKIGGLVRYRISDLKEYLEGRVRNSTSDA